MQHNSWQQLYRYLHSLLPTLRLVFCISNVRSVQQKEAIGLPEISLTVHSTSQDSPTLLALLKITTNYSFFRSYFYAVDIWFSFYSWARFPLCRKGTLTDTLKGEVFAASMELVFSDVLVPEMLRLRGDLSAGTSKEEQKKVVNGCRGWGSVRFCASAKFQVHTGLLNYTHLVFMSYLPPKLQWHFHWQIQGCESDLIGGKRQ